ncbi:mechanosensitive ion channel domain-containing protein [Trinickia caryophylli]|uniref:Small-conductance mechanosensitive channel n=1 Tax=Trinickia caryophylli TaxID=28094 RepID=A0A1X7GCZ4_TRICW|nr:mechanosensitive ion channel domain-containing protein [Trinickia caryophylli]PMS10809.1 mechanosensitive ion channel protein [Trinickia caryophylli]TRX13814.1 mechanosensitive ion channel [Trinickia caryophylli]WQE15405.1 mechanosensitive ion channel [Trinickia caryophylli]SMF67852.1 Small-conductance mechanosensitive channel [Trinickia caryophylli]GLU33859.1 hypothetical protein Busp01_37010 [Trinickia caryophylli]
MRKLTAAVFFFFLSTVVAYAAAASAPTGASGTAASAGASNPSPVTLTPDEAKRALDAINDPKSRARISDTLRAIAAAGALSAPPEQASAASSAAPASGASAVLAAISENGLVSQLARQTAVSLRNAAVSVRRSMAALLDVHSVRAWWRNEFSNSAGRAQLRSLAGTLCAALLPAWLIGIFIGRLMKKRIDALAGERAMNETNVADSAETADAADAADQAAAETEQAIKQAGAQTIDPNAAREARSQRNAAHAGRHWSLLQRLPFALLHTLLKAVPVVVTIAIAVLAMSALTDDGTAEERVLDTLIEVYAIARAIMLVGGLLFACDAPRLRLLPMSDASAASVERWLNRLVVVVGTGIALAEAPVPLGLSAEAHLGIVKAVSLIGHIMVALLILQVRRPVAQWIRTSTSHSRGLSLAGHWLADAWAFLAIFVVMALWFVWALDVRDGYRVLLGRGGASVAVLIGARFVAIVTFGVLGRIFRYGDGQMGSIALTRAHRYYPLLRRAISIAIVLVALDLLLSVWGIHPWQAILAKGVGKRLVSACATVGIAAVVAIVVWEAINVSIERRLGKWTAAGDLIRAARLRTLLPMFRTMLFIGIALVVGLTGLSEIGVNIGPLLAGASIFGVAIGFGSQKLVQDFITGMFLLMENAMQVGDWVTVAGVSGTVEYLSIRTVRLRAGDGSLHTIPFSSVTTVNNSNRGLGNASVKIAIAFDQDVDFAVQTLSEIGASLREDPQFKDGIVSDFSFWGVDQVDGATVTLLGQMQCRDTARWPVQREFNRRILKRFRERGIQIANPLRTVVVRGDAGQPEGGLDDGDGGPPARSEGGAAPQGKPNAPHRG